MLESYLEASYLISAILILSKKKKKKKNLESVKIWTGDASTINLLVPGVH